ncbi:HpaII family restriction endonuclease [Candidatus Kaiserbacteria bacterium]|nr:HpaII family restriction endonuclease [Candidatus Kaiserbacteria bacterium]
MDENNTTTGNTGEWSELYTLGFLLVNGGAYAADERQNRNEEIFYQVLKIIFDGKSGAEKITYQADDDTIKIFSNSTEIANVKIEKLKKILIKLLEQLSATNEGRAYSLDAGSQMMELLRKDVIKAASSDKKDLDLVLLDLKTQQPTPEIGFSIKSQLGSPSTLINASMATNFTYEILDANGNVPTEFPELHDKNVKDNICLLLSSGYKIEFINADSEIFSNNLNLIDSNLQDYLAKILLSYYSREANKVSELIEINYPETDTNNSNAIHKIKEFLGVMALGMMPNTSWDGILTSLGGFLLVKKDGDVLCYYLYNLKDFYQYLVNNTKLETPSTTRYGIGRIIENNGRFYIKLNLQVRFLK